MVRGHASRKELTTVRCENGTQTFTRFEFGS
jgi:hypothetical protein